MYANVTKIKLSIRSSIPPWPGIKLLKSLILFSLLILLNTKSPNCPIIDKSIVNDNTFNKFSEDIILV